MTQFINDNEGSLIEVVDLKVAITHLAVYLGQLHEWSKIGQSKDELIAQILESFIYQTLPAQGK